MSDWQLIKTDTLCKIENTAHDLKDISHTPEIVGSANDIIICCNEAVPCNKKTTTREVKMPVVLFDGINKLFDHMLTYDHGIAELEGDIKEIKDMMNSSVSFTDYVDRRFIK